MIKQVSEERRKIYEKSAGKCWYCGCDLKAKGWQADHFHPVIRCDGIPLYPELDTFENMVPSCPPCNNFKSSSNIAGFKLRIAEQFQNALFRSTGLRQLNRLGLIDIEPKPVSLWFEEQGLKVPDEVYFYGISGLGNKIIWEYDSEEACHVATIGSFIVSARKNPSGILGLLVIATGSDWEQHRTEINGARFAMERVAEWALGINETFKNSNTL